MAEVYGQSFDIEGTATTTDTRYNWQTGIAHTGTEVNRPIRVRKVTVSNDGAVNLIYHLSTDTSFLHTLKAGETSHHNVISDGLWVDAASATCAFRAWGLG